MRPRILWRRERQQGVVMILGVDGETANRVLASALEKMANTWLRHDVEGGKIMIAQPADGNFGGAAEREHVDRLVRWVRDTVKAELKAEKKS